MKTVVCFGDSNTWGYKPGNGERYDWETRWTGILQNRLGSEYRVHEEGLPGRTTCYPDPLSPGRNGMEFLPVVLGTHAPIDLLIIMLGTNDTKAHLGLGAFDIAKGVGKLLETAASEVGQILLISPLPVVPTPDYEKALSFAGAIEKSQKLAEYYLHFASKSGCHFLNGATVGESSNVDGIHLSAETHHALGERVAEIAKRIL